MKSIAYLVIASLCLLKLYSYWSPPRAEPRTSARVLASQLLGSQISPDGTDLNAGHTRVVIAITTMSIFGRASAPFYKRLLERVIPSAAGRVAVIAVMPERKEVAVNYLRETLGLKIDAVIAELPGVHIRATPTVLVVDAKGTVKGAWVGVLGPSAENDVIATILANSSDERMN